ncbi:hypothetical protein ACJX0J_012931, partial [Zea mays]
MLLATGAQFFSIFDTATCHMLFSLAFVDCLKPEWIWGTRAHGIYLGSVFNNEFSSISISSTILGLIETLLESEIHLQAQGGKNETKNRFLISNLNIWTFGDHAETLIQILMSLQQIGPYCYLLF